MIIVFFGFVYFCGIVIFFRLKFELFNLVFDLNGRFVLVYFKYRGICFDVVFIYVFNRNFERNDFLDFCIDNIDFLIFIVVCGDFNIVMDRVLDRRGFDFLDFFRENLFNFNVFFLSVVFWIFGVFFILIFWFLFG